MTSQTYTTNNDLEIALPNHSVEKDRDTLRFVMLSEMSVKEKDEFRQKVERSNGTIQVWIHTHYSGGFGSESSNESFRDYKYLRDKSISSSTNEMPIVTFIEAPPGFEDEIEKYRLLYSKLTSGSIYVVPTFQTTSVPCIVDREDTLVKYHKTEVKNWDIIGEMFAKLGVKRVIIRGRNLGFSEIKPDDFTLAQDIYSKIEKLDISKPVNIPDQCLGNAIVQLKARGFEILPSRVTYPSRMR